MYFGEGTLKTESSVGIVLLLVSITFLLCTIVPGVCAKNQDYILLSEISPPTETKLSIGTKVTLVVVLDYHLSNASIGTIVLEVLDGKNDSVVDPLSLRVSQGNGTVYFRETIELPDTPSLTILAYLVPLNSEFASATTSISYELDGFYLSNWYIGFAIIELILALALFAIYYLAIRKKHVSPENLREAGHVEGKLLLEFFTIVTGLLSGFIFLLMWERLLIKNWPSVILLILIFLMLLDDWYGSYRRYSNLPYYLGHFILDIIETFVFLAMAYTIALETTAIVAAIYLYALHGLLWDIYYASKTQSNSSRRKDLETSLHYAFLLASTFALIQFYFGWSHMFTIRWENTAYILLGWVVCRVFLSYAQKRRSNLVDEDVKKLEKKKGEKHEKNKA